MFELGLELGSLDWALGPHHTVSGLYVPIHCWGGGGDVQQRDTSYARRRRHRDL